MNVFLLCFSNEIKRRKVVRTDHSHVRLNRTERDRVSCTLVNSYNFEFIRNIETKMIYFCRKMLHLRADLNLRDCKFQSNRNTRRLHRRWCGGQSGALLVEVGGQNLNSEFKIFGLKINLIIRDDLSFNGSWCWFYYRWMIVLDDIN